MDSLRRLRPLVVVCLVGVALDACGSGSTSSPTSSSPVPVISNFASAYLGTACTRVADGLTGSLYSLTFDYTDSDGNVSGGHVQIMRAFNTGKLETFLDTVPSAVAPVVTITGTTSGQIRMTDCPVFATATSYTRTITLFDASNNQSNALSSTVNKPAGAP